MAKKLILLVSNYLGERDYKRFGIEVLQANGLDVEVWECVTPMRGHKESPEPPPFFPGILRFESMKGIFQRIDQLDHDDVVLSLAGTTFIARLLHRRLNRRGIRYGQYKSGFGFFQSSRSSLKNLRERILFRLADPQALLEGVTARIPDRLLGIKPSFQFLCGGDSARQGSPGNEIADLVWAHQLDFDLYLEAGQPEADAKPNHIVFVDEYLPFHPDWKALGTRAPVTADKYYPKLVTLFEYLESRFDLPVVVAAHPRSSYEAHPDYFGERKITRGHTVELIRDSACVILSASTSLNFAVLYGKPILFVTTDEIRQNYLPLGLVENLSRALEKSPVNLDEDLAPDLTRELTVDTEAYREYSATYIKRPGTPAINSWAILAGYLNCQARS